jgi:hypothetical protein
MNGIDALALCIAYHEGPLRPRERNFRNNNPGNLRSPKWAIKDANGFDVYPDFITGYERLCDDLADKFQAGKNEHGLSQTSTLTDLFKIYAPAEDSNNPESYAAFAAGWLQSALNKQITVTTPLSLIWTAPPPA